MLNHTITNDLNHINTNLQSQSCQVLQRELQCNGENKFFFTNTCTQMNKVFLANKNSKAI